VARSQITLVAHTHWDREWYEPFEVFRAHLIEMLDEALDALEGDWRLSFTLDGHVAMVDDYLEARPQNERRIIALVKGGRLHIGPWFTQADTLLTDGESVIRNLLFGMRRAEHLGGSLRVGYMPDQFGHAAQVPQILSLFGIETAVLWRGVGPERPPHAFRWFAPDGSAVTAIWLQDGYGSGRRFPSDPQGFATAVERALARLRDWIGDSPMLVPVGDDHVRLAVWLPDAADALRQRRPDLEVVVGGYQDHFAQLGEVSHRIVGELRSPAFAPVLAGVASARISEKQAGAHATRLLLGYAEPLAAWTRAPTSSMVSDLISRAWRQLLLNQAHDSIAGCGIDAAHEDVKARYRWAQQIAQAAIDRSLQQIKVEPHGSAATQLSIFHPGPAANTTMIETQIPRALSEAIVAVSADGIRRPIQRLGVEDERPIFEGEFAANELGQYLGGLDPATPLFGRYLSGITIHDDGAGVVRLDAGLGPNPVAPASLAADQERVASLLNTVERFRVFVHAAGTTRPVLLQAGPAVEAGFLAVAIEPGVPDSDVPRAGRLPQKNGICAGPLSVEARPDGTVLIRDQRFSVRANDLVDEGDRGDLYHCDPLAPQVRSSSATATVIEEGPVRARLRIVQELDLPVALDASRRGRSLVTHPVNVITEVSLWAGERRVELVTVLENVSCDHRLRALIHLPFKAERIDTEHGLAVVQRPLDPCNALGGGSEHAAPTGQHHAFVDVSGEGVGLALMSPGLPEHEVLPDVDGCVLALTLLRGVGWLSRGDLSVIEHAAGPIIATPGGQELGSHAFRYGLLLHDGDWQRGGALAEAARFAAPPIAFAANGSIPVPSGRALVAVTPGRVRLTSVRRAESGNGLTVRLLNASHDQVETILEPARPIESACSVDPLERPLHENACELRHGLVYLSLRPWQIATVLLR
jgi:mannosylglycerate hydrolase